MKILHVHPTLGIGGVETYLYRLSAGLGAGGHHVAVLSEGGALEDRVAKSGAQLVKIAPREENLEQIAAQTSGFDLVHAHNYRVAGFSKKLAAKIGAKYLLSVHGPRHFWQLLPFKDWSEIVIAMSEGDRDNITGLGGIAKNRVRLSFYGIDPERFRPNLPTQSLRQELGLGEENRVLLYVSRFSNRKADVGVELVQALSQLHREFPELRLFMLGHGPEQAKLEHAIELINKVLGAEIATMIGPRDDVEKWMNLADCAVATANTALEAMACGAPTIAAGRTGYHGLVSPENFEKGRATCFGDHGKPPFSLSANRMAQDVKKALKNPLEVSQIVAQNYDVARMTEGTEAIYREVLGR